MTFLDDGGAETDTGSEGHPAAPIGAPGPPPGPDAPALPPVLRLAAPPPMPPRPPIVAPRPVGGVPLPPGVTPTMAEAMTRLAVQERSASRRRGRTRRRSRVRDLVRALVFGVLVTAYVLLRTGAVSWFVRHHLDDDTTVVARTQVTTWDPRVVDLVSFVETERGLTFDHPVPVDFLPEDEFVALFEVPTSTAAPSAEQLDAERAGTAWWDDLGLAVGYSPSEGQASLDATTTLGFYSPTDDRVFVRGDVLTPAVRTVLAHELTHALQAQHFDLSLGGDDDLTIRSIVEADAMRVEDAYVATLPAADQASAEQENTLSTSEKAQLDVVPWAVVEAQYAPYVIGPSVVDAAYRAGGNAAVDALMADPPTEETLISPWLQHVPQTDVQPPVPVPPGATVVVPEQRLSMFDVLVMLDAWLSWTQARGALDGWAGGRMVMYELTDGGPICLAGSIAYDESPAAMAEALTAWAAAAGSPLTPTVVDRQVTFEACPRGEGALAPPDPVVSTIQAIDIEHVILDGVDAATAPDDVTRFTCYARRLIDDPSLAPLMFDDALDADETAILEWVTTAAASTCGLPPT